MNRYEQIREELRLRELHWRKELEEGNPEKMNKVTLSDYAYNQLMEWLKGREQDIALGGEDFRKLRSFYYELIGKLPSD